MSRATEADALVYQKRLARARRQWCLASKPERQPEGDTGSRRAMPELFGARVGRGLEVQTMRATIGIGVSVNSLYVNVPSKGRVLSKAGREFKQATIRMIQAESCRRRFIYAEGQRVRIRLEYYFGDNRRDVSNTAKVITDSIAEAIGFNDKVVDRESAERVGFDSTSPRCEVLVEKV